METRPHRRFEGGKLVIASHNPGKVSEIAALLAPYGAEAVSAADLGLPEPKETGDIQTILNLSVGMLGINSAVAVARF